MKPEGNSAAAASSGGGAEAPDAAPADVAIVGGGPAGSALAALLARQGRRVALLEKDAFPRDKLCGEFLSPEALESLREIGCLDAVLAAGPARVGRARFTAPSGRVLELPLAGEGLGVSRRVLDAALLAHAAACGARVIAEAEARAVAAPAAGGNARIDARRRDGSITELRAAGVVLAHGRRGRLDRRLERPFLARASPHVGVKRHCLPASPEAAARLAGALAGVVEVHAFRGGYCGLSFVEGGRVNVCSLLHQAMLRGLHGRAWEDIAAAMAGANPRLGERLSDLVPADGAIHSVARVPLCGKERAAGPVLFLGDAAGMIAPLCGDGQAMALRSAILLAGLFAAEPGELSGPALLRIAGRWETRWRREFNSRMRLGRALQAGLLRPALAELGLRLLRRFPALGARLVKATRGAPARG